jgi:hypothetical protein
MGELPEPPCQPLSDEPYVMHGIVSGISGLSEAQMGKEFKMIATKYLISYA